MSKVKILPEFLINKIAAGEVVERPASVVKELVENAIDAGGDQIFVTVKNGGKDLISVLDNGEGMSQTDAQLAIERHATSKIKTDKDLESITTMGFRGEALAAIAAVSRFELSTCSDEETGGFQIRVEGGRVVHSAKMGFPKGTRIVVENLFFNTPARQKFMKSVNTEYNHIHDLVIRLALGNPSIQFRLMHNKNLVLNIPKDADFKQRISHCFGSEISKGLIDCQHEESYLKFDGLISIPTQAKSSKRWQHIFVNDRYVKCKSVNHAIYEGYKTLLMKHAHPAFFMRLHLPPTEIDVNVHPAKTEIRLKNTNLVHTILSEQISLQLKKQERATFTGNRPLQENKGDHNKEIATPGKPEETADLPSCNQEPRADSIEPQTKEPDYPPIYKETDDQLGFMTETGTATKPKPRKETGPDPEPALAETPPETPDDPFPFNQGEDALEVNNDLVSGFTVIGQLLSKYIVVQGENKLILIDQHAAHERVRFEEIRRQYYSQKLPTQTLLVPILMELPPHDGLLLEQYQDSWEKMGFYIDHFGGNDYSVKEIPAILKDADIVNIIKEVLDEMAQFGKSGKLELFFNQVFEKMACHSAVRASQYLSMEEMKALVNQLVQYNIMLHCPHGRPVWIELTLDDLDKRFKRI